MELSRVGADLFGVADAAVLRTLAIQGRAVSGREIARLAELNQSSARRALLRWVETGLVSATTSSHATLYTINRAHLLWPPIEAVLAAPSRLEREIAALVEAHAADGTTAAIFGSVARRDSTASSDVDIVLVSPDDADPSQREGLVDDLRALVSSSTGNDAHLVDVTRRQLQDMVAQGDPLAAAWSAEARTVAGPDLVRAIASA
ncbi:nucleotidyltransferase domain-containing protein [Rathayibacter festucae]|uniref:nucleotidyltransferase domain-containing protein n=1 Tax=Rathayibacter festucae TaxID=110937 RepID=UPI002A6A6761|nr:nucleotidyltransferase domain-containing protein [Rathayibacter festucae]MDY0912842.1 nucleotidyltransferase domain-containing protein [Rathayibacter festucae]